MAVIGFTSCSEKENDFSGKWEIYSFEINGIQQQLAVSGINFEKQSETTYSVNGNAGINSFFGDVTITGTKINAGDKFGSTKMAGDPAVMEFEDNFLKCLTGASSAKIKSEGNAEFLVISNSKDKSILTFIKK